MSKIVLYPANGFDFDAADVAAYLAGLTSGVFSSAEDFPVTAAGGLTVTVGAGRGWVHPSRFTGYSITKREADTLTLPLADPSLPRIDRIVMRYDAGARAASLQVLQGTASSTPTAPAISRTELIYDLCLAEITRPAGSTAVTTGQITDTRLDEKLCGIVRDGVTGIPTDELLAAARERIATLEENASNSAAAAKDSAEAAKSSETKSAASEKNAKDSETNAQRALQDTETKHTAALKDIAQARTAALNDVAASTKTATAAGSASTAATKAGEASTSAGAASTSRQAAEKAQKAAEDAAALAGTRAGTDKTLRVEDAPADAAAVRKLIEESLAAQREEDYKRVRYWASNDPTSPASFIGGTWERVEGEFIMGASSAYPVGTTGGSATHTQTTAEMPSHNHSGSTGSAGGHSHSASTGSAGSHSHSGTTDWAGSHSHNVNAEYKSGGDDGESYRIRDYGASWANYKFTTSSDGSHTHSFSTNSAGGHSHSVSIGDAGAHTHTVSIGSTGSGQAMSVLNPYYALYIWVRVDDAA